MTLMSAEKILHEEKNLTTITTPVTSEVKFNGHVDINDLLARVRKEKNKENKENFIFFGLISALVLVVGIILSF